MATMHSGPEMPQVQTSKDLEGRFSHWQWTDAEANEENAPPGKKINYKKANKWREEHGLPLWKLPGDDGEKE